MFIAAPIEKYVFTPRLPNITALFPSAKAANGLEIGNSYLERII